MMVVNHNFFLGTTSLGPEKNKQYTFSCQVADETGVLVARVDGDGGVEGQIHKPLFGNENFSAQGKLSMVASPGKGDIDHLLGSVDFTAPTWTGNVKYGAIFGGTMAGCNYFQSITPKLSVGGDCMYIGSQDMCAGTYGVRYAGDNWMSCIQYIGNQQALAAHYKRTVTKDRVQLGAELQVNVATLENNVQFGGEFNLKQSKVHTVFGGDGRIQNTVDIKLGPAAMLNFSAEAHHQKDLFKFGYGLTIGG